MTNFDRLASGAAFSISRPGCWKVCRCPIGPLHREAECVLLVSLVDIALKLLFKLFHLANLSLLLLFFLLFVHLSVFVELIDAAEDAKGDHTPNACPHNHRRLVVIFLFILTTPGVANQISYRLVRATCAVTLGSH